MILPPIGGSVEISAFLSRDTAKPVPSDRVPTHGCIAGFAIGATGGKGNPCRTPESLSGGELARRPIQGGRTPWEPVKELAHTEQ
jgi:hypothetical protein